MLQGACELVERHVCCLADRDMPELPTIDLSPGTLGDPVLEDLARRFRSNGIEVLLKDFSLGMPVPTVAALAYDPENFPERSEIVFTAGTASGPAKAAIRALTEVAQLAGDFNNSACYEASGLPKYDNLAQTDWLRRGPLAPLGSLPSVEADDMLDELQALARGLDALGFPLHVVSTTNPATGVPTHYSFAPGLAFRERDKNASLGLFVGRMLGEESKGRAPSRSLEILAELCPGAHFIPFFRGMAALHAGDTRQAARLFEESEGAQPDDEAKAMAAFYHGYALSLDGGWQQARPALERAARLCPDMKGFRNHLGVCLFKLGRHAEAAEQFSYIIGRLDKGSAIDIQNLGLCHKFMGNNEAARHFLAAALRLDPGLEAARRHLKELGAA
jgi:ribosomal protein S12 methylthiotransferase accessory factor